MWEGGRGGWGHGWGERRLRRRNRGVEGEAVIMEPTMADSAPWREHRRGPERARRTREKPLAASGRAVAGERQEPNLKCTESRTDRQQ